MKYLLVLAVVMIALWLWRSGRSADQAGKGASHPGTAAQPQDMVECPVCSVHLPRSDALPGPNGRLYCCAEHRLRAQG
jgi:uncharacterized protein